MSAMDWLTTDLNLLEADAEILRRHLGWLVDDLRVHRVGLNGQAAELEVLATDVSDCLERLGKLDSVLRRVRETVPSA